MKRGIVTDYSSLNDKQWHQLVLSSMTDTSLGLPGFPPQRTQEIFVGKSHETALQEAFDFFCAIKNAAPINSRTKILDFGVGWGRIIRYFAKDVRASNLFGVDVDPEILAECRRLNIPGVLQHIDPTGRLPHKSGSLDIVYSFSVFSHLSEASAKHWLRELMRVLRGGGTLVLTTTSDKFLNLCAACKQKAEARNYYEEIYANLFQDPASELKKYNHGEHVYSAVGGNSDSLKPTNYGWASMPPLFVDREIGDLSSSIEFSDDPANFEQAIFIIKKKNTKLQLMKKRILGA